MPSGWCCPWICCCTEGFCLPDSTIWTRRLWGRGRSCCICSGGRIPSCSFTGSRPLCAVLLIPPAWRNRTITAYAAMRFTNPGRFPISRCWAFPWKRIWRRYIRRFCPARWRTIWPDGSAMWPWIRRFFPMWRMGLWTGWCFLRMTAAPTAMPLWISKRCLGESGSLGWRSGWRCIRGRTRWE